MTLPRRGMNGPLVTVRQRKCRLLDKKGYGLYGDYRANNWNPHALSVLNQQRIARAPDVTVDQLHISNSVKVKLLNNKVSHSDFPTTFNLRENVTTLFFLGDSKRGVIVKKVPSYFKSSIEGTFCFILGKDVEKIADERPAATSARPHNHHVEGASLT